MCVDQNNNILENEVVYAWLSENEIEVSVISFPAKHLLVHSHQ